MVAVLEVKRKSSFHIPQVKPWSKLRLSRREYEKARLWKKAGLTRTEYESLIDALPTEILDGLKLEAEADKLVNAIFKNL